MVAKLTLYTYPGSTRAMKAQIAAKFVGVEIEVPPFSMGSDNRADWFLAKNPLGRVPVLETSDGCIFESNAIARYVARIRADAGLLGSSFLEQGQVDQWVDFAVNEIELPASAWIYPILGFVAYDEKATEKAKQDIKKSLGVLEKHLASHEFVVGSRATLADVCIVSSLLNLFRMVLDPSYRENIPNVTKWFSKCIAIPEFKSVVGEVKLAEKEMVAEGATQS